MKRLINLDGMAHFMTMAATGSIRGRRRTPRNIGVGRQPGHSRLCLTSSV